MSTNPEHALNIRPVAISDQDGIWEIFSQVVRRGDTYAFDPNTTREGMVELWLAPSMQTFVATNDSRIVGTYFIKANQPGLGAHVANCGYMVHPEARGKGIGRALCLHSLEVARDLGYRGMQFNIVVSTNTAAVRLWQDLGFKIVGTVPEGFRHRQLGYVDTYIMYKGV